MPTISLKSMIDLCNEHGLCSLWRTNSVFIHNFDKCLCWNDSCHLILASHQNKWTGILPSRFPLRFYATYHVCYMLLPTHPPWYDHSTASCKEHISGSPSLWNINQPSVAYTVSGNMFFSARASPLCCSNAQPTLVSLYTWNTSIGQLHRHHPYPAEYAETDVSKHSTFINL
jgi:hypothetical protein